MSKKKIEYRNKNCVYCGEPANGVDHVVPISRGGSKKKKENQVPCCKLCNGTKGNNTVGDFLEFLQFMREHNKTLKSLSRKQRKKYKLLFYAKTGVWLGDESYPHTVNLHAKSTVCIM